MTGTRIAHVVVESGWGLDVHQHQHAEMAVYHAQVRDPEDRIRYVAYFWPSAEAAIESAAGFVQHGVGLPTTATALRYSALAEVRA